MLNRRPPGPAVSTRPAPACRAAGLLLSDKPLRGREHAFSGLCPQHVTLLLSIIEHLLHWCLDHRRGGASQAQPSQQRAQPQGWRGDSSGFTGTSSATKQQAPGMARGRFLQERSLRGALETNKSCQGKKGECVSWGEGGVEWGGGPVGPGLRSVKSSQWERRGPFVLHEEIDAHRRKEDRHRWPNWASRFRRRDPSPLPPASCYQSRGRKHLGGGPAGSVERCDP